MKLTTDQLIPVQQSLSMSIKEIESKTPTDHLIYTSHKCMKQLLEAVEEEINKVVHKQVRCCLCKKNTSSQTAHRHQNKYIGECCWDDRLKSSE